MSVSTRWCFVTGDTDYDDEYLHHVMTTVQNEGRTWFGPTRWRGRNACRISICSAATIERDIEIALGAIRSAMELAAATRIDHGVREMLQPRLPAA